MPVMVVCAATNPDGSEDVDEELGGLLVVLNIGRINKCMELF